MASYLYIVVLAVLLSYTIINDILMFKRGRYYPYILKHGRGELPSVVRFGIALFICIGGAVFVTDSKILHGMLYVFIVYTSCMIISTSTLNYLSYLKSKDCNIIIQTVVFDIIVTCVSVWVWRFIIK